MSKRGSKIFYQRGSTIAEYSILVAFMMIVALVAIRSVESSIQETLDASFTTASGGVNVVDPSGKKT